MEQYKVIFITKNRHLKFLRILFFILIAELSSFCVYAQGPESINQKEIIQEDQAIPLPVKPDLEFNLNLNAEQIPVSKIFSASIDLSGRGFHEDKTWPYNVASWQALEQWQKSIGFNKGIYRIHWNLWQTHHSDTKIDGHLRDQIIANYEKIIKEISDSGGIVILSLYGTPPGFGRALDKRSPPANLKQWKLLVKDIIRYLSCQKNYKVWYEVWDAPDTDNFFLGVKQDYLNLYRFTAEAVKELKREYKKDIFLGGPAVTWWFQNLDGNTVIFPEKSLIYELIKFTARYKLPLDFISWHAYSTDAYAEKEATIYNKNVSSLIRDWLSFFRLKKETPLIIDEWNFDSGINLIRERGDRSYISASYIPARLKNMYESGIDYHTFFSLEDFQHKNEINNNRGLLTYDPQSSDSQISPKSLYNVFLMLKQIGNKYIKYSTNNEFVDILVTRDKDDVILIIWNYIDPYIGRSLISRNVSMLGEKDRAYLQNITRDDKLDKLISGEIPIDTAVCSDKLKNLLKKSFMLQQLSLQWLSKPVTVKIKLSNIQGKYLLQRYSVNDSCFRDCEFVPIEEMEIDANAIYEHILTLNPYSVDLVTLRKK